MKVQYRTVNNEPNAKVIAGGVAALLVPWVAYGIDWVVAQAAIVDGGDTAFLSVIAAVASWFFGYVKRPDARDGVVKEFEGDTG